MSQDGLDLLKAHVELKIKCEDYKKALDAQAEWVVELLRHRAQAFERDQLPAIGQALRSVADEIEKGPQPALPKDEKNAP